MKKFFIEHPTLYKWKNLMKKLIAAIVLSFGVGLGIGHIPFDNFLHIGWYQFGLVMLLTLIGSTLAYFNSKNKKENEPENKFVFVVLVFILYAVVSWCVNRYDFYAYKNNHYGVNIQCTICENNTVIYQEKGKFWGELDSVNCDNCGLKLDVTKHPEYKEKLELFQTRKHSKDQNG